MGADRSVTLPPEQRAVKVACLAAVKAAGGQVFVGEQLRLSQGRVSDLCCATSNEWLRLDQAMAIDALGAGVSGAPFITRALNSLFGQTAIEPDPDPGAAGWHLSRWLAEICGESSDVVRLLADGLGATGSARESFRRLSPAERGRLQHELAGLMDVLAGLNAELSEWREDSS